MGSSTTLREGNNRMILITLKMDDLDNFKMDDLDNSLEDADHADDADDSKRDALENEDSALEDLDNFLVDKDLDDSLADDEPLEDCEDVLDEHTDVVSE